MKVFNFLPALVFLSSFLSCKKENTNHTVIDIRFSRNALDYVNLQQGKYFIYKDSASGTTDSVVVTTSVLQSIYFPENNTNWVIVGAHNRERLTLRLDVKKNNGSSSQWFYGTAETFVVFPMASDTAYISLYGGESNIMSEVFLRFHYQTNTESMTVEGTLYDKVVTHVNENGLQVSDPNYRKTIYYWAKGIGIIKRTVITAGGSAKTYTLLRHN